MPLQCEKKEGGRKGEVFSSKQGGDRFLRNEEGVPDRDQDRKRGLRSPKVGTSALLGGERGEGAWFPKKRKKKRGFD